MKITLTTIGNTELEFDVKDDKKAIENLAFWQELPSKCPKCGKDTYFTFRQPQGFTYYGLSCTGKPAHESVFGQRKEGDGLFYKGEWHENTFGRSDEESDAPEHTNNPDSPRGKMIDK